MAIEVTGKNGAEDIKNFPGSVGAKEINEQTAETGWWLGRYDQESRLYSEPVTVKA
ncbi:hypothetical protein MKQ70_26135 [Chitinophaga sedimenti]|uniref:hypothetical protein n=1 Tax=Chitinophaga sedimenti TaxID=2033606 RepID=UPI00200659E3|nr:hypothetical protein [Chitinophaga sedimenti]MCK7558291.1 hypothetical protein [Chitinophaga sedimenti]